MFERPDFFERIVAVIVDEAHCRGGGSATATAVPIVKQTVGMVKVEALKREWHLKSREHVQCAYWRKVS